MEGLEERGSRRHTVCKVDEPGFFPVFLSVYGVIEKYLEGNIYCCCFTKVYIALR